MTFLGLLYIHDVLERLLHLQVGDAQITLNYLLFVQLLLEVSTA